MKSERILVTLGICIVVAAALVAGSGGIAHAATITVNTTDDELNADGDCSLREAIEAANTNTPVDACAAGSGADTIVVPAGTYTLSIPGTDEDANATGDLDIRGNVTITGDGAATTIIDGAQLDQVVEIRGGSVEFSGLTVSNGLGSSAGGIENRGTLTLNDSIVSGNSATGTTGASATGGIWNAKSGTLTLNHSSVSGNSGTGGSGALGIGGIYNAKSASLTLNHSRVNGNSGTAIGGMFNSYESTMILNDSTVSGNSVTTDYGTGGIKGRGTMKFDNSTVSDNSVIGDYGVGGLGVFQWATATINNSTFSGNSATGLYPNGGIENFQYSTLTITNSTVSGNVSIGDHPEGGVRSAAGIQNYQYSILTINNSTVSGNSGTGILAVQFAEATVKNTILADNGASDCLGTIISAGHNLIESAGDCTITGDTTGNIVGADALLGPLADNGGPTQTHALLDGSPAIDAGSSDCPPPAADQRGVPRPLDGDGDAIAICDIGAFEKMDPSLDMDPFLDSDADGCTDLREMGENEMMGGQRDNFYFWDFYDVWTHPPGDPAGWERDEVLNVFDMLAVGQRFGPGPVLSEEEALVQALIPPTDTTSYHPAYDRGPVIGATNWERAPADGSINVVDDILGVAQQFGHNCA